MLKGKFVLVVVLITYNQIQKIMLFAPRGKLLMTSVFMALRVQISFTPVKDKR